MPLLASYKASRIVGICVPLFLLIIVLRLFAPDRINLWASQAEGRPGIVHKTLGERPLAQRPFLPVEENFPLAAVAKSPFDLPPILPWNQPPNPHVPEPTPIFIGFTRNWSLLQQAVVSLLTSGWPASDIYIVENTGVMDANQHNRLSPQNPFYLDHHRLTEILGVNVLVTPSLQTFAQLQNFYLHQAIINNWPTYFWAHMDIVVQSSELPPQPPSDTSETSISEHKSYYLRAVETMRSSIDRSQTSTTYRWALRYFAYDWITLMNTATLTELGGWDNMISYYTADCDLYERMRMAGFETETADAGFVYDVGSSLHDLIDFYRVGNGDEGIGGKGYVALRERLKGLQHEKLHGGDRNRWQIQQRGGQGDGGWYRDPDGFVEALEIMVKAGIEVYGKKWGGAKGCALRDRGLRGDDAWMVKSVG